MAKKAGFFLQAILQGLAFTPGALESDWNISTKVEKASIIWFFKTEDVIESMGASMYAGDQTEWLQLETRKEVMVSWTKVVVEETKEENMQNQFNGKIDRTSW